MHLIKTQEIKPLTFDEIARYKHESVDRDRLLSMVTSPRGSSHPVNLGPIGYVDHEVTRGTSSAHSLMPSGSLITVSILENPSDDVDRFFGREDLRYGFKQEEDRGAHLG